MKAFLPALEIFCELFGFPAENGLHIPADIVQTWSGLQFIGKHHGRAFCYEKIKPCRCFQQFLFGMLKVVYFGGCPIPFRNTALLITHRGCTAQVPFVRAIPLKKTMFDFMGLARIYGVLPCVNCTFKILRVHHH